MINKSESKLHYIIEMVNNEYQVVVSQPMLTLCSYDDLDEIFDTSIHIGILGNLNENNINDKFYNTLAYRLLVPLLRMFRIKKTEIYTHCQLSSEEYCDCINYNLDMILIHQYIRKFLKQTSVTF